MCTLLQQSYYILTVVVVIIHFGPGTAADSNKCSSTSSLMSCQTFGTSIKGMGQSFLSRSMARLTDELYTSSLEMEMCEEAQVYKSCIELFITRCVTASMRRFEPIAQLIKDFRQSAAQLEETCSPVNIQSVAAVTQNILSVDSVGCDASIAMQPCDSFGEMLQEKAKSLLRSSLNVLLGGQLTIDVCREGQSTQACSELFLLRCVSDSVRTSEPIVQQIQTSRRNAVKLHNSCKSIFGALIPDV